MTKNRENGSDGSDLGDELEVAGQIAGRLPKGCLEAVVEFLVRFFAGSTLVLAVPTNAFVAIVGRTKTGDSWTPLSVQNRLLIGVTAIIFGLLLAAWVSNRPTLPFILGLVWGLVCLFLLVVMETNVWR
jgi:hypothetical protein